MISPNVPDSPEGFEATISVDVPTDDAAASNIASAGFDAARRQREEDHLDRWPLAEEIYHIASAGPKDWSVRVGVYGEWGTGKTSVLEFVSAMANQDGHIVRWFNPWQYSTKDELWQAFVLNIFSDPTLANIEGANFAQAKKWIRHLTDTGRVAQAGADLIHSGSGKLVGGGLDLLKKWFAFSASDLRALRSALGEKRVIVLIDDLDRTSAELVPEILFALKSVMDTPGFSFVAAFDPRKVGEVLRKQNPGFGDGLRFLEKIIDYPRWLPPAPWEGLTKLAIADANRYCPYVPDQEIRAAVPLLPRNPRAIRQFIRLLSLLKPQIDRYYERELHWPTILAANVLKIRHPLIAYPLLTDEAFWERIDETPLLARDGEAPAEIEKHIKEHIDTVAKSLELALSESDKSEIKTALARICAQFNRWALRTTAYLVEQIQVGEAPHAVTWKEFDKFLEAWSSGVSATKVEEWIEIHSKRVHRSEERVYVELLEASAVAYSNALSEADSGFFASESNPAEIKAESLVGLIEYLVFRLGRLGQTQKWIGAKQLKRLVDSFTPYVSGGTAIQAKFSSKNEVILTKLIATWTGDLAPLTEVVQPYDHFGFSHYDGSHLRALHKRLSETLLRKIAEQVISGIREPAYIEHLINVDSPTWFARRMILDPEGVLWNELRPQTIEAFHGAAINRSIQENAYQLLYWFQYKLQHEGGTEKEWLCKLLAQEDVVEVLWCAATATQLGVVPISRLHAFPGIAQKLGSTVKIPAWWQAVADRFSKERESLSQSREADVATK